MTEQYVRCYSDKAALMNTAPQVGDEKHPTSRLIGVQTTASPAADFLAVTICQESGVNRFRV